MISMDVIEDVGRRIGSQFRPDRVILFGSHVDGRATADSDVDLLVIMPTDRSPIDESVAIRLAVRPPFPMDVLVRTPAMIAPGFFRLRSVFSLKNRSTWGAAGDAGAGRELTGRENTAESRPAVAMKHFGA